MHTTTRAANMSPTSGDPPLVVGHQLGNRKELRLSSSGMSTLVVEVKFPKPDDLVVE